MHAHQPQSRAPVRFPPLLCAFPFPTLADCVAAGQSQGGGPPAKTRRPSPGCPRSCCGCSDAPCRNAKAGPGCESGLDCTLWGEQTRPHDELSSPSPSTSPSPSLSLPSPRVLWIPHALAYFLGCFLGPPRPGDCRRRPVPLALTTFTLTTRSATTLWSV